MATRLTVALAILGLALAVLFRPDVPSSFAQASGAPMLLVTNSASSNPFGPFLGEILRTEGITTFDTAQLSAVTQSQLSGYATVILAETSLTSTQAGLFSTYVNGGGSLIAMKPDSQLNGILGLTAASGTTTDGYFKASGTHALASGLSQSTLQIHGVSNNYNLNGAEALATLYSNATTATTFPAATLNTVGTGQAAAFTYDLARSVAYTRQGNPATAGTDRDGDGVIRTIDGFMGWLNPDKTAIPQADEQQRLLRNLITSFSTQRVPLPQLWYFPTIAQKSALVVTGDDHGQTNSQFTSMTSIVAGHGGRMTFYLSRYGQLSQSTASTLKSQGHELSIHPYGKADNQTLDQGYVAAINWFVNLGAGNLGGYGQPTATVRNHQVEWQGWAAAANIARSHGFELSTDFYTWGSWLRKSDNSLACTGYVNGSGQPMKFVETNGTIYPIYQQVTSLVDEQMITSADNGPCAMTEQQAIPVSKALMDQSVAGDYSAILMQAHVDYGALTWLDGVTGYAQQLGMPIWTAQHWLDFTKARQGANVTQMTWTPASTALTFCVTTPSSEPTLTLMFPASYGATAIGTVTVDGVAATKTAFTLKGMDYSTFPVSGGTRAVAIKYGTGTATSPTCTVPPTATPTTGATSTPVPTNTATVAPATNTPTLGPTPTAQPVNGTQTDTTVADFATCAIPAGLTAANVSGGELRRTAALEDYFDGALSSGKWSWGTWSGGSYTPAPSGGSLAVGGATGAFIQSQATFTQQTVEGRVTFGAGPWQHVGFADAGFASRYAILSTGSTSDTLIARTYNNGSETATTIAGAAPGSAADVQIVWQATKVDYYLNGTLVVSHPVAITQAMYVYASDNGAAPLSVDWLRAAPYTTGTTAYVSCVKDSGGAGWGAINWTATVPTGTTLLMETRTSTDGTTWSAWTTATNGSAPGSPTGRFLQYRATLGTTDAQQSPTLSDVSVRIVGAPTATPTNPPATNTPVATATNTPLPTATNTPVPTAPIITVTGSQTDTAVADFTGCVVPAGLTAANVSGGELRKTAALEDYFDGALSSSKWSSGTWSGGSYTPAPSGGSLAVAGANGAFIQSQATFTQQSVEGRVTFGAGPWQHVGFADAGITSQFAMFSTGSTSNTLIARTFVGGNETATTIAGATPGTAADVRIDWQATKVDYYLNGTLVASHAVAVTQPMYVYASNNGAASLSVDWLRVASYTTGTTAYVSCIKDGGLSADWTSISWDAIVPINTTLVVERRTSDDLSTWSAWTATTSGAAITTPNPRYLQYRLTLGTTAAGSSPEVRSVTVATSAGGAAPATATNTPVATPTNTSVPAATPTNTAVPAATATNTAVPTATNTPLPTATPTPQTVDSSSTSIVYSGTWATTFNASMVGGSERSTTSTTPSATLQFTGNKITVVYTKSSGRGIARVTIDGATVATIDQWALLTSYQQKTSYTVTPGTHTIVVKNSGTRNFLSTGSTVGIDAFVIN